jgi:hypothetical protein
MKLSYGYIISLVQEVYYINFHPGKDELSNEDRTDNTAYSVKYTRSARSKNHQWVEGSSKSERCFILLILCKGESKPNSLYK